MPTSSMPPPPPVQGRPSASAGRPGTRATEARPWMFHRSRDRRILYGVTAGLGQRIGVDPLVVRIAMVVLTLAGGAGLVLYGLGWLMSRDPQPGEVVRVQGVDRRQAAALALMTLGLTLLLRQLGVWLSDALVWPAMVGGTITALIWVQAGPHDEHDRTTLLDLSPARVIVASLVLLAGVITFWVLVPNRTEVLVPLAGIAVGAALLAAPFLTSVWERIQREQAARARVQARDEVAAHLHDSVLQTLTLIQRTDDPRRATMLARTQERELRSWLYGTRDLQAVARDLATAVEDLVTEVELHHELEVDVVTVGTLPRVDEHPAAPALLAALREALVNVALHADVPTASLYVEVEEERLSAFVRDRGRGFDADAVPEDRHGVRNSIRDRMLRHRGGSTITTAPGGGTEVEVWVPHDPNWVDDLEPLVPTMRPDPGTGAADPTTPDTAATDPMPPSTAARAGSGSDPTPPASPPTTGGPR